MNLFNIVPSNYFSIFQGKNREIYIESLEILYSLLQNEEAVIKKSDFLSALKAKEIELNAFDVYEEIKNEGEEINLTSIPSKANYIVRKLEETGWIDSMMDLDNNEEIIVLPAYTISLIKCFSEIVSDEETPYNSLVHSTYSELKLEEEEMDDLLYATLLRCYENTKKLKVELVTLMHSIRIFENRLSALFDTNEVLHTYFDIYKNRISDRYYHPLKTFDSVAKFRRPIIKILDNWLQNKEIREKLILQASLGSKNNKKEEIESEVIQKINYITDTYESLNSLISTIDKENSNYTKASTNKILYLNNNDKTIKGHLENIMKCYASNYKDINVRKKVLDMIDDSISFYDLGYIDSYSITLPILKKFKNDNQPLEIISFDDANDFIMDNFLEETKNIYTDEKVYGFMRECFGDKNEITSKDIRLNNIDSLICLILATVKNDENSFYVVDDSSTEKVINNNYLIPLFTYTKKEIKGEE